MSARDEIGCHITRFIEAFVIDRKKGRYRSLWRTKKGKRFHLWFEDLDPRFVCELKLCKLSVAELAARLRADGSPDDVLVMISPLRGYDSFPMRYEWNRLEEALIENVGPPRECFISCVPGRLGIYNSHEELVYYCKRDMG